MQLKIRTIYFKTRDISGLKKFYSELFDISPKPNKNTDDWVEFDFGNINFSLLNISDDDWTNSNCVPVFEFEAKAVKLLKQKVKQHGGSIIVEDYDGFSSAVCKDIQGNEFEITSFHD